MMGGKKIFSILTGDHLKMLGTNGLYEHKWGGSRIEKLAGVGPNFLNHRGKQLKMKREIKGIVRSLLSVSKR